MSEQSHPRVHLYGIDPGSSKPWAVYECSFSAAGNVEECRYREWEIEELGGLLDQIVGRAADHPILLSIDAPINRTATFQVAGGGGNPMFPFNTNPFTVRPCERALMRVPQVLDRNLRFPHLVDMIAALCGWQRDYGRAAGNRPFVELHEGVSVLGYMSAPHGPVVSLFLRQLAERHPNLSCSPREACRPLRGRVYVLESHPAVSLGLWAADGRLGEVATVPRYKSEGDDTLEGGLQQLRGPTVRLATEVYGAAPPAPRTDDELDALVGLLNLLDLVAGRGDWFGCEALGYFLIPLFSRYPQGDGYLDTIGEAWEAAFVQLSGGAAGRTPAFVSAHLRMARPTDDLDAVVRFYRDGLGFEVLSEFHNHDGFDGVMLGHAGAGYHLEFTRKAGYPAGRAPTEDNLLVFYLPAPTAWSSAVARMEATGYAPVPAFNPYWDRHGKTFEDPDGYRVVLQNAAWPGRAE